MDREKNKLNELHVEIIEKCLERGNDVLLRKNKEEIKVYELNQKRVK